MRPGPAALAAALAAVATAGCVVHPGTARPATFGELRREGGWVLLDAVPFAPQATGEDCGAACLSMVLARWGVEAPAADLARECSVEGEEGLRASALRDAARRRGLKAYLLAGSVEDLGHELRRRRPVVVGLLKSLGPLSASHFVVVVGLREREGEVAALDPAAGLVRDSLPAFAGEWAATGRATLVAFRPRGEGAPAARAEAGP
jgi:ABC-type bacteriocin/lantibiotic exporter with double-glycine peptidase domain